MDTKRRAELKAAYKQSVPRAGVIKVTNTANGKIFIIGSIDVDARINRLKAELTFPGGQLGDLNDDWQQYGADAFTIEVIDLVEKPDDLSEEKLRREVESLEALYIDQHQSWGDCGYNAPPKQD